jgi:hypothetical protein
MDTDKHGFLATETQRHREKNFRFEIRDFKNTLQKETKKTKREDFNHGWTLIDTDLNNKDANFRFEIGNLKGVLQKGTKGTKPEDFNHGWTLINTDF